MIKGFRFTNQLANAEIDARIHQEFLNKNDGIFYGMELSKTTNSITISEGLCEISGRPVAVIDSETITVGTESLYCILVLEIDLSKESTKDIFNQVSFKLLTSSVDYPTVTQQDINKYNSTNTIYQLEFARFRSGTNGITDFKDTRKLLSFSGIYAQIKADCEEVIKQIKQELASVEDGSAYILKNNIVILRGVMTLEPNTETALENGYMQQTIKDIDFPEGYTRDNCTVMSFGGCFYPDKKGYVYGDTSGSSADSSGLLSGAVPKAIHLGGTVGTEYENKIRIEVYNKSTSQKEYYYKIVLIKYEVSENEYTLGDVNGDGVIDETDLSMIKNYNTGEIALTEKQFLAADMNNDGKVSPSDYILLKNQLGIID